MLSCQHATAALTAASSANFSQIYAASGDPDHLAQLTKEARDQHGFIVTTKSKLLHGEDLEELAAMSWDQQALVDYEMLLKSSFSCWGCSRVAFHTVLRSRDAACLCQKKMTNGGKDEDLGPEQRPWWGEKWSSSSSDGSPRDSLSTLLGDRQAGYLFGSPIWP